jgi:hypothetical protein
MSSLFDSEISSRSSGDSRVTFDTIGLLVAKTIHVHLATKKISSISIDDIVEKIKISCQQTLEFMELDMQGHDFPFESIKKLVSGKFAGMEFTNEDDVVIQVINKLGYCSVVSTETLSGNKTVCAVTLDSKKNVLTASSFISTEAVNRNLDSMVSTVSDTLVIIDYIPASQFPGLNRLGQLKFDILLTPNFTLDMYNRYTKRTNTRVMSTYATGYDLAATPFGASVTTGKEGVVIGMLPDGIIQAFFTYNPNPNAENTLELKDEHKYLTQTAFDLYSVEEIKEFVNTEQYISTSDFRDLGDRFIIGLSNSGVTNPTYKSGDRKSLG